MTNDQGQTWWSFDVPAPPAFDRDPLSFHSDPKKYDHVLYQAWVCKHEWRTCKDVVSCLWAGQLQFARSHTAMQTYFTTDNFAHQEVLLEDIRRCDFAHSSREFKHDAPVDMVYCVALTNRANGDLTVRCPRLVQSTDWFKKERLIVDFGFSEENTREVVKFGTSSKFGVAVLRNPGSDGTMTLFVTTDTLNWFEVFLPPATTSVLREYGYTIVEDMVHSLGVDVLLQTSAGIGTLYVSDSNGTYFVESLNNTNYDWFGFIDFRTIDSVDGVRLANIVSNAPEVEAGREAKRLASRITFDNGASWSPITAPSTNAKGRAVLCDISDSGKCSLHLYLIAASPVLGRIFSNTAPGFILGVGSIGPALRPYDDCDMFLSTDAGVSWTRILVGPHKYEFGNQGGILAMVEDDKPTEVLKYSFDSGSSWNELKLPVKLRVERLTSVPHERSQQFLLIGVLAREDVSSIERYAAIHVDLAPIRQRECATYDEETFRVRTGKGQECMMGHRQIYTRKKPSVDCYIDKQFDEPIAHQERCNCSDDDYECDYSYVRSGDACEPNGLEPIPAGACSSDWQQTYMGSSGWRLIPGNTCKAGLSRKDAKVEKRCPEPKHREGEVSHQVVGLNIHLCLCLCF